MSEYLSPLQFPALPVRPSLPDLGLDLDLDHAEGSEATISLSSESDHFDVARSIVNHDHVSEITKTTEATAVDDDDDGVDGALFPVYGPLRSKESQHLQIVLLPAEICTGKEKVVHGACFNDEPSLRGIVDTALGVTPMDKDSDSLAIQLDQGIGPGRYNHNLNLGISDAAQSPRTEEANDAEPKGGSSLLNDSWKHPNESTFEATKVIQRTEKLRVLPDLTMSGQSPGVKKSSACGPFSTAMNSLMPVKHLCATEDRSSPTEAQWKALSSPYVLNTARQTQVHELNGAIHRLMPPDRIICFDVDEESFARGGVPNDVTQRIVSAAERVAQVIKSQNLGINFEYKPDSASPVFNIRYDPNLGPRTLAQAFFPTDSRKIWQLRISSGLAFSENARSGLLDYIPNILAHEFTHILGLRHWNAGFDPGELREPSLLWPKTIERSRVSVMNTGVHPNHIRFSEEDFRVIREIYSVANGAFCAGRKIIDVNPSAGSHKL
ncbi:hypothetical protein SLS64_008489 [Diaporthe eres]|uniref:Uncharacterized protein n=1 Tax=Diaporthe eres TaxID=83184 RepID=A0ABR1PKU2_DIAER